LAGCCLADRSRRSPMNARVSSGSKPSFANAK
jgi:hypothetical protein